MVRRPVFLEFFLGNARLAFDVERKPDKSLFCRHDIERVITIEGAYQINLCQLRYPYGAARETGRF